MDGGPNGLEDLGRPKRYGAEVDFASIGRIVDSRTLGFLHESGLDKGPEGQLKKRKGSK